MITITIPKKKGESDARYKRRVCRLWREAVLSMAEGLRTNMKAIMDSRPLPDDEYLRELRMESLDRIDKGVDRMLRNLLG